MPFTSPPAKKVAWLLAAGLGISSLIISPFVLDFTFSPRQITLAFTLMVCAAISLFSFKDSRVFLPAPIVWFGITALYFALSLFWALNRYEARADVGRQAAGLGLMLLIWITVSVNRAAVKKILVELAALLSLFLFAVFLYQLSQVGGLEKELMYQVTGLNGHKNLFSSFLFLLTVVVVYGFAGSILLTRSQRGFAISALVCNVAVLTCLRTKAVLVGILFAALLLALFYLMGRLRLNKTRRFVVGAAVLVMLNVFFLTLLPVLVDRALIAQNDSLPKILSMFVDTERLLLWQKTFGVIHKECLFGVGAGNWQIFFPAEGLSGLWRAEDLNYTFQRPHNDFLWIAAEGGLVGMNLWFIFLLSLFGLAISNPLTGRNRFSVHLLAAGIGGFMAISFFDFPRERFEHLIWFIVVVVLLISESRAHEEISGTRTLPVKALVPVIFMLALFAGCGGVSRYKAEVYTRKLYDARTRLQQQEVISCAGKAANPFYSLDPTSVPLPWYAGNAQATLGYMEASYNSFLEAYRLHPYNRNVLNDLASALVIKGDTTAAIKYYQLSSEISPRFDEPKLNLATVYLHQNKLRSALTVLDSLKHDSERRTQLETIVRARLGVE